MEGLEVASPPGGGEEASSVHSQHAARDATLGTITEETDYPRLPASPDQRTAAVKKTPSYRGSAK